MDTAVGAISKLNPRLELPGEGFPLSARPRRAAATAVHPYFVANGARRLRGFDVARSPALAEFSKFVGSLTLKRPEGRVPTNRQLVDALDSMPSTILALSAQYACGILTVP